MFDKKKMPNFQFYQKKIEGILSESEETQSISSEVFLRDLSLEFSDEFFKK